MRAIVIGFDIDNFPSSAPNVNIPVVVAKYEDADQTIRVNLSSFRDDGADKLGIGAVIDVTLNGLDIVGRLVTAAKRPHLPSPTDVYSDLALIRHGVDLAERREKHPSYQMELRSILETIDLLEKTVRFVLGRNFIM